MQLGSPGKYASKGETTVAVKGLVQVARKAALKAVMAFDKMGGGLNARQAHRPKRLKRKYKEARHELLAAIGHMEFCFDPPDKARSRIKKWGAPLGLL